MIRYLDPSEHVNTRKMWEEIFVDDSKAFLDYYFSEKTRTNQILVIEEENNEDIDREYWVQAQDVSGGNNRLLSMLSLNPYKMNMINGIVDVNYIVGVATDSEHRHQGHMKNLLVESLRDMYKNKEPFTFLMPAAEAIYKPFDFRFIYDQNGCEIKQESLKKIADKKSKLLCRPATEQDIQMLVEFSLLTLKERYEVYTYRDQEYYEVLMKEAISENGEILLIFEESLLCGYCIYGIGELLEVREPICKKGYEAKFIVSLFQTLMKFQKDIKLSGIDYYLADTLKNGDHNYDIKKTPMIMARIVNFISFISRLKAKGGLDIVIQIKDPIIPDNNNIFHLYTVKDNSYIEVSKTEKEADISITISELTSFLFGYKRMEELEEISQIIADNSALKELEKIDTPRKIFINEVV